MGQNLTAEETWWAQAGQSFAQKLSHVIQMAVALL